jgi:hypothetical protein
MPAAAAKAFIDQAHADKQKARLMGQVGIMPEYETYPAMDEWLAIGAAEAQRAQQAAAQEAQTKEILKQIEAAARIESEVAPAQIYAGGAGERELMKGQVALTKQQMSDAAAMERARLMAASREAVARIPRVSRRTGRTPSSIPVETRYAGELNKLARNLQAEKKALQGKLMLTQEDRQKLADIEDRLALVQDATAHLGTGRQLPPEIRQELQRAFGGGQGTAPAVPQTAAESTTQDLKEAARRAMRGEE